MSASLNTARALLSAGNHESARQAVRQFLEDEPDDIDALILMVDIEVAAGKHTRALEVIEQALAKQPDNFSLRNCELEIYIRMGKKRRARLGLKRFREDFSYLGALIERQDVLYEMKFGSGKQAAKKLREFSETGNEAAEGVLQTNAGRLLDGQRLLNIALENDPSNHMVNKSLAVNQLLLARPTSARRAACRGLLNMPTDGQLRWIKIQTYFAYFPPVYLWHFLFAIAFLAYGRLTLIPTIPIAIFLYFVSGGSIDTFEATITHLGVPYFSTISSACTLTYFLGFILLQTSVPNRVFGAKRKVKFKDY